MAIPCEVSEGFRKGEVQSGLETGREDMRLQTLVSRKEEKGAADNGPGLHCINIYTNSIN